MTKKSNSPNQRKVQLNWFRISQALCYNEIQDTRQSELKALRWEAILKAQPDSNMHSCTMLYAVCIF